MRSGPVATNLPLVRRLEAVGFRAWPAASVQYDGSWQVRLTGGHPSKRLNCIVALDPSDYRDIGQRLERAARKFDAHGRPALVRETPLAPPLMVAYMEQEGWAPIEESITMVVDLFRADIAGQMDHLPSHDIGRFVDAVLAVSGEDVSLKPGLAEIVTAIKPPNGLFVMEDPAAGPVGVLLCVQDNDIAGINSLAVAKSHRRRGIGREILFSALRWARMCGARSAWLQVLADNEAALALYRAIGFEEAYRYRYWRKGEQR